MSEVIFIAAGKNDIQTIREMQNVYSMANPWNTSGTGTFR